MLEVLKYYITLNITSRNVKKKSVPYQTHLLEISALLSLRCNEEYNSYNLALLQVWHKKTFCGQIKIFFSFSIPSSLKILTAFIRNLTRNNRFIYLLVAV